MEKEFYRPQHLAQIQACDSEWMADRLALNDGDEEEEEEGLSCYTKSGLLSIDDVFAAGGPYSVVLEGYTPRRQQISISKSIQSIMHSRGICVAEAPTGTGKCFQAGTPILMFDGTIKQVQEIEIGDRVMGADSQPRTVLSLHQGQDEMFKITPTKGMAYVVNQSHILSLKMTKGINISQANPFSDRKIVNISVHDYLLQTKTFQHCAKGYRVGIDFPSQPISLDPYFLGIWLGDGNENVPSITTGDQEIASFLDDYAKEFDLKLNKSNIKANCAAYKLTTGTNKTANRWQPNPITQLLRCYNLVKNKHIPHSYKVNSRDIRLQVLAGVIDTDGSLSCAGYEVSSNRKQLADDITFLAQSLGFAAYSKPCKKTCYNTGKIGDYWRVFISGEVSVIPVRIPHKKAQPRKQIKDVLVTGIRVEPIGQGDYYGFETDGDHLFLLGDFTVVHNSAAYLVPAIERALNGERTVISTGTIALQTQLITKDVPDALKAMNAENSVKVVVMKGRSNFLCKMELDKEIEQNLLADYDEDFQKVRQKSYDMFWDGDKGTLGFVYENWHKVSATRDSCTSRKCPHYKDCYYYQAKAEAKEAQIIIANHSLVMADLTFQNRTGMGGIIPKYTHIVFDEGHHIENVATEAFGIEMSNSRIYNLCQRIRKSKHVRLPDNLVLDLETMNEYLFSLFKTKMEETNRKEATFEAFLYGDDWITAKTIASECMKLCDALVANLPASQEEPKAEHERTTLERTLNRVCEEIYLLFADDLLEEKVRWCVREEARGKRKERYVLKMQFLHAGRILASMLWKPLEEREGSATIISATLATNGGFEFLRSRLCLPRKAEEIIVDSPFDYKQNCLLYVPIELPEPPKEFSDTYADLACERIMNLLALTMGRAFILFTSWKAMHEMQKRVEGMIPYPLFIQGQKPPRDLVKGFKASGNGVLLGTASFWEGVDIPGDALSLVIIDRIPFTVPTSPLESARMKRIEAEMGKHASFTHYSIPQAQIKLKQGFGRLIRTKTDRGIVCVLDTRLIKKGYGATIVNSLPPASRASLWPRVVKFWNTANERRS